MDFESDKLPYVRWACRNRTAGDDWLPNRQLCDHLLVIGSRGKGEVRLNDSIYPVIVDTLFLVTPSTWYHFTSSEPGGMDVLAVHFDWQRCADSRSFPMHGDADGKASRFREPREFDHWPIATQPSIDLSGRPRVGNAIAEIVTAFGRFDDIAPYETGALLAVALSLIARETRLLHTVARYEHVGADAVLRVDAARRLLEAVNERPASVDDVAAAVGWSADHLRRMCRAVLGASPLHVQRNALIRRAKELLASSPISVSEVAEYCGCDDQAYFGRIFKAETGMSPGQYRSSLRG